MQKPFDQKQQRSNQTLQNFRTYLEEQSSLWEWIHFDMERFGEDLTQGLYFDSVIPVHYGLGSSGALVAAIYREYAGDHLKAASLTELKHLFAGAEAFFHGRSSGIDPLTSYVGKPLIFTDQIDQVPTKNDLQQLNQSWFLFDSGSPSGTGDLVALFVEKLSNKKFSSGFTREYVNLIDQAVVHMRNENDGVLSQHMKRISLLQLKYFREMIPGSIVPLWKQGLKSGDYSMKLCGSGGGGYFLIHTKLPEENLLEYFPGPLTRVLFAI